MEMPQFNKNSAQPVSMPVHPRSAQRSLVKVESGIKGLLPTSWAPPIYSVSLLTKLRCALAGNSSFACDSCSLVPRSHLPNAKTRRKKKSEKTRQGLYNVGFIGGENKRAAPQTTPMQWHKYLDGDPAVIWESGEFRSQ